jgi:hypothetical protein
MKWIVHDIIIAIILKDSWVFQDFDKWESEARRSRALGRRYSHQGDTLKVPTGGSPGQWVCLPKRDNLCFVRRDGLFARQKVIPSLYLPVAAQRGEKSAYPKIVWRPCPSQANSYDCGVYVMAYMEMFLATGEVASGGKVLTPDFVTQYRREFRAQNVEMARQ